VKEERWHRLMAAQREVSRELMAAKIGTTTDVVIDRVEDGGVVGRSKWDAPEIDGSVFLNDAKGLKPGDIVPARVTRADEYDLWAEPQAPGTTR